jgi:hypothetical protein
VIPSQNRPKLGCGAVFGWYAPNRWCDLPCEPRSLRILKASMALVSSCGLIQVSFSRFHQNTATNDGKPLFTGSRPQPPLREFRDSNAHKTHLSRVNGTLRSDVHSSTRDMMGINGGRGVNKPESQRMFENQGGGATSDPRGQFIRNLHVHFIDMDSSANGTHRACSSSSTASRIAFIIA